MYVLQLILNFFIPSGSTKAVLTMPLLAPLADLSGITRQTLVLAYQLGAGFTSMIIPTRRDGRHAGAGQDPVRAVGQVALAAAAGVLRLLAPGANLAGAHRLELTSNGLVTELSA